MRASRLHVVFAAAFIACNRERATAPATDLTGVFQLESVNGSTLPVLEFQDSSGKTELVSDQLIALNDGTWSELTTFHHTNADVVNRSQGVSTGTYATTDGQTRFTYTGGGKGTFNVSYDSGRLTLKPPGSVLVYSRGPLK